MKIKRTQHLYQDKGPLKLLVERICVDKNRSPIILSTNSQFNNKKIVRIPYQFFYLKYCMLTFLQLNITCLILSKSNFSIFLVKILIKLKLLLKFIKK